MKKSENSTGKKSLYLPILNKLKEGTNLTKIRNELSISKENLNYYLRRLNKDGLILHKGRGWYEPSKKSENTTKHGIPLSKDIIRGHAYVWTLNINKIKNWDKRIEILKKRGVNFVLVGALKTTPRIKVLGRKVWLCNNHLRVFDKKEQSYYGKDAKESKSIAFQEIKLIVGALNNKLGLSIKPSAILFKKEHYAMIKNDLAIEENRRGNIWRIKDEDGEWLLIDDSLEKGGELETVGKKAFQTNIPMQKWWNDNKEHNFKVTPTFLMETLSKLTLAQVEGQNQLLQYAEQNKQHLALIKEYRKENISWRKKKTKEIKKELTLGHQTKLGDF